jgi:hypothetical protein
MKHQTRDQLESVAKIQAQPQPSMTRDERLARWAENLEREPGRCLSSLAGTEHQASGTRAMMRGADSPIALAFADATLRDEGMKDDTYGEAKRFFGLTDRQLHDVVCYCHFGETVRAATAASRVRAAMGARRGFLSRLRAAVFG